MIILVGTEVWHGEWNGWELGLMVGRIMCLCGGILYHGLVQIRDFFFYNHIMLVKVMNVWGASTSNVHAWLHTSHVILLFFTLQQLPTLLTQYALLV